MYGPNRLYVAVVYDRVRAGYKNARVFRATIRIVGSRRAHTHRAIYLSIYLSIKISLISSSKNLLPLLSVLWPAFLSPLPDAPKSSFMT